MAIPGASSVTTVIEAPKKQWLTARIAEIIDETPRVRTLMLDVPGWPGHKAGQHVDVRLTSEDGYQAQRSYSIASAPGEARVRLTIEMLTEGEVSSYLAGEARVGDSIEMRGPIGGYFVWSEALEGPLFLVGGGSGIVPLIAMIRSHAASESTAKFRLLYSVRTPEDAFFADELARLEGDGLEITWVYTRQAPEGWPTPAGRVTLDALRSATFPSSGTPAVFVCGPTGFVESVATWLVELGHEPAAVKTERFGGA